VVGLSSSFFRISSVTFNPAVVALCEHQPNSHIILNISTINQISKNRKGQTYQETRTLA
jgi:hypothetical protein